MGVCLGGLPKRGLCLEGVLPRKGLPRGFWLEGVLSRQEGLPGEGGLPRGLPRRVSA